MIAFFLALAIRHQPTDAARESEIRQKWQAAQATLPKNPFIDTPIAGSFHPGKPDDAVLKSGLKVIQFSRWLAGLGTELQLSEELSSDAQCGSLLLATSSFEHFAAQPAGMPGEIFAKGARATANGNIAYRRGSQISLADMMLDQLADVGPNAFTVAHRRWLLNPELGRVGIGYVIKPAKKEAFSTVVIIDRSGKPGQWQSVRWPTPGPFPMELVPRGLPWSITFNPDVYNLKRTAEWELSWRLNKGEIQTIRPQDENEGTSDRLWATWETTSFGAGNAIIFLPPNNAMLKAGDVCDIGLSGLRKYDGTEVSFNYSVKLFWMKKPQSKKGKTG